MFNRTYVLPQQHVEFGQLHGYPMCCIRAFIPFYLHSQEYMRQYTNSPFYGSGYLPCMCCMQRDPHEVTTEINERRNQLLRPFTLEKLLSRRNNHE